jgi:hypothetical protein
MATAADKAKSNGEPSASAILTVEAIIAAKDLKEEVIEVPEWGGSVKVRSFSKKGQQEVRELATINDEIDPERLEMFMFIHGVVDPPFTNDTYELLRDKNAGVIDRVLQRIMSISGMDQEALAKAQEKFPNQS